MAKDPLVLTREHVIADAAVLSLISTRLYPTMLPRVNNVFPAASMMVIGGSSETIVPIQDALVQFSCWSELTRLEARSIYEAIRDALHGIEMITVASGFIFSALESVPAQDLIDKDANPELYRTLGTFNVKYRTD